MTPERSAMPFSLTTSRDNTGMSKARMLQTDGRDVDKNILLKSLNDKSDQLTNPSTTQ